MVLPVVVACRVGAFRECTRDVGGYGRICIALVAGAHLDTGHCETVPGPSAETAADQHLDIELAADVYQLSVAPTVRSDDLG